MTIVPSPTAARMAELLESESLYFELAAQRRPLYGCELVFVPDLVMLPAACVAQRIEGALVELNPGRFLAELETACGELGAPLVRFYLSDPAPGVVAALDEHGYGAKVEVGFLRPCDSAPIDVRVDPDRLSLRLVESESDWSDKRSIHLREDIGSDGYRNRGREWTELMRRKAATGFKRSFLIEYDSAPVGAIAVVRCGGVCRVKNVFLLRDFRRQGLATAALARLLQVHISAHQVAGLFGIVGSPGYSLYLRCGFRPVLEQVEFTKPLARLVQARSAPKPR